MNQADFLEEFVEHLQIKYMHWLFEGNLTNNDAIIEFLDWCIKDANKELHEPRGKDGKSFFQRRELTS